MFCSQSEMFTIINVPQGVHQYKFLVDGRWLCHPYEVCIALVLYCLKINYNIRVKGIIVT